ncbi:MAG: MFS transporter [Thermomicrobiales bacterium]
MSGSSTAVEQANAPEVSWPERIGIPALVTATTISNIGNGITNLAIPWFVLVTTGSPARTGIAGALVVLANVLSSFLGGAVVDRLGHKRASIFSDLLSGITVAIIPTLYFADVLEFWMLLALIFAGAVFDAPGSVARNALIPRLARQARMPLERANSAMQFADQGSRSLIGPLAAGLLIGFMSAASVLYIDAATFAISVIVIGLLVRPLARSAANGRAADAVEVPADESFIDSIRAGFRFALKDDFLRLVMPISLLFNFVISPLVAVVLPVLARDEFDSATALGFMIAAFGLGSALGTLAFGWKGHTLSRSWTFLAGVTMFAVSFWIIPLASSVWIGMLATGLLGLAVGPTNVLGMTLMQSRVPEEMLGRVLGFVFAIGAALAPLGVFLAGILIEATSLQTVMIASAVLTTIGTLRTYMLRDIVRQFDAEIESGGELGKSEA